MYIVGDKPTMIETLIDFNCSIFEVAYLNTQCIRYRVTLLFLLVVMYDIL